MSHVMSNLEIREFNINDIEELYEVELTSFTDPWSKESFKDELNNENITEQYNHLLSLVKEKEREFIEWHLFSKEKKTVAQKVRYSRLVKKIKQINKTNEQERA